ncbi:MAG: hypothetical protein LZF86_240017 [Nitrospira sp.]|nr:MAG: hypothetical protein LZF86_240017 [Nitrospira sp.]
MALVSHNCGKMDLPRISVLFPFKMRFLSIKKRFHRMMRHTHPLSNPSTGAQVSGYNRGHAAHTHSPNASGKAGRGNRKTPDPALPPGRSSHCRLSTD